MGHAPECPPAGPLRPAERDHAMRYHGMRATRAALVLAVAAALAATMTPSGGAAEPQPGAAAKSGVTAEKKPNYDARSAGSRRLRDARVLATPSAGVRTLRHQLGTQGIVSIDPLTRTPRIVSKVDGFLTGRSTASARGIALGYVLRHPDVFPAVRA